MLRTPVVKSDLTGAQSLICRRLTALVLEVLDRERVVAVQPCSTIAAETRRHCADAPSAAASRHAGCFAIIWVPAGWERHLKAQAHHRPITATERPAQIGARGGPHFSPNGSCVALATPPPAADKPLQTRHAGSCRGPRPRSPNAPARSTS